MPLSLKKMVIKMEIIIGKTAGFCYGVERAVNSAKDELEKNKDLYCLGEIVHNKNVIERLKNNGIKFIENIGESKGKTIIRAHGVSKEIYEKAEKMNIELKDLTCPSVLKIHNIAEEYAKKGYFIILTGKENHPEVIGIKSYCGSNYCVIYEVSEVFDIIKKLKNDKVLLISQTTYSSKKFDEIERILKENIDSTIELKVIKTICASTEIRQKETEDIAKKVDMMIIIGDKKSSNTNKLYDISCNYCKNVIFVVDASELDVNAVKNKEKIGIMAGASTAKEDIIDVKNKILGVI